MFGFTVNLRVRQLIIRTMFRSTLKNVPFSSLLTHIPTRQEQPRLIIDALYYVKLLIKKLASIYYGYFERGCVVHELESMVNQPRVGELQQVQNDANMDQIGTMTDDTEKKQEGNEKDKRRDAVDGSSQGQSSFPQRRVLDRSGLQFTSESEKDLGRGSIRKYTIQLAQNSSADYFHAGEINANGAPLRVPGSTLKGTTTFTGQLLNSQGKESYEKILMPVSMYMKKLMLCPHEALSRAETFEVVSPP